MGHEKDFRNLDTGFVVKRNGFTLIELLVVVAITGILAAAGVVALSALNLSSLFREIT